MHSPWSTYVFTVVLWVWERSEDQPNIFILPIKGWLQHLFFMVNR